MERIEMGTVALEFDQGTLAFAMEKEGERWNWDSDYRPMMECEEGQFYFADAEIITHEMHENGIGKGIRSRYEGFRQAGKKYGYIFETFVWIETGTEDIRFEWIPVKEEGLHVKKVYWPGEVEFAERKDTWYTLLPHQQGMMIPNTWETELGRLPFGGYFGTADGYMPWFAQVRDRKGCLAICETPWNAGYKAAHPAGGGQTKVAVWYELSLGRMDYRRILRYTLCSDCDHNTICKIYRKYVKENGRLRTLAEKSIMAPSVDRLIGSVFVHKGIKTVVQPDSDFFDADAPEKNNSLTTFAKRAEEIRELHEKGVEKLYLHLDGWAQPGYDNQHPDYLPACAEAGGWEGMRELADTMHDCGYLFGIHDQYRDYYLASPGYDETLACRLPDGTVPGHKRWAGGPQTYLCATQAPYFVKRNFGELKKNGIRLDGAYLDVFTCNEGDECADPMHRMTRRDCYELRSQCFAYLLSEGILSSSEEVSDWAVPNLVFCHYAPYEFMMKKPGSPKEGIPVPLYNLVYHDCVIQPWMMEKYEEGEDYMLYALLNGGAPYLIRDAAYQNTDGAFSGDVEFDLDEKICRSREVAALHEKVGKCEMVSHEFPEGNYNIQRTTFSDGTQVTVDFLNNTYKIQ